MAEGVPNGLESNGDDYQVCQQVTSKSRQLFNFHLSFASLEAFCL